MEEVIYSLSPEQFEILIAHLNNLSAGLQIIIYVAVAFLIWKVITIIHKLFGGIFFGGV